MFETVHTYTDWYDGPIGGVANYHGRPHVYEAQWDDRTGCFGGLFRLSPIDAETLQLALEDWDIWLRWDTAYQAGEVSVTTHPALPADRARWETLQSLLGTKLKIDPEKAFFVCGEFRWVHRPPRESIAEVRWSPAD